MEGFIRLYPINPQSCFLVIMLKISDSLILDKIQCIVIRKLFNDSFYRFGTNS